MAAEKHILCLLFYSQADDSQRFTREKLISYLLQAKRDEPIDTAGFEAVIDSLVGRDLISETEQGYRVTQSGTNALLSPPPVPQDLRARIAYGLRHPS